VIRVITRCLAGVIVAALLCACGQKGALYLPDKGGEIVTRPAGSTTPASTAPAPAGTQSSGSPQNSEPAPQPAGQPPDAATKKPESDEKTPK
jgi:predicted small lipoprotein YifL